MQRHARLRCFACQCLQSLFEHLAPRVYPTKAFVRWKPPFACEGIKTTSASSQWLSEVVVADAFFAPSSALHGHSSSSQLRVLWGQLLELIFQLACRCRFCYRHSCRVLCRRRARSGIVSLSRHNNPKIFPPLLQDSGPLSLSSASQTNLHSFHPLSSPLGAILRAVHVPSHRVFQALWTRCQSRGS